MGHGPKTVAGEWKTTALNALTDKDDAAHVVVALVRSHGPEAINAALEEIGAGTRLSSLLAAPPSFKDGDRVKHRESGQKGTVSRQDGHVVHVLMDNRVGTHDDGTRAFVLSAVVKLVPKGTKKAVAPVDDPETDKLEDRIKAAAKAHGEESEPDMETGDIEAALSAAWKYLTPEGRRAAFAEVKDDVEQWEGGGD